jgi:hypothetical protein
MKDMEENDGGKLLISLVEPVVYLKSAGFSGRRLTRNGLVPPSMIRGVLTLRLSKPTKISSIGIELTAKSYIRLPHGTLSILNHYHINSPTPAFFGEP